MRARLASQQAKNLAASAFDLGLVANRRPLCLGESVRIFVHTKIWTRRSPMNLVLGGAGFAFSPAIWAKNI
jgi:hypothetical protein